MSMIAVVLVIRSPLTDIASAPASHSSSTTIRRSRPLTTSSAVAPPGGGGAVESDSWRTIPGPRRAMRPPAMRASSRRSFRSRDLGGRSLALRLERPDLFIQGEDPRLERVLVGRQTEGGLDERRALLGRVADPRALGPQLGSDEKAQRQERQAEGHLPRRQGADTSGQAGHGSGSCDAVGGPVWW